MLVNSPYRKAVLSASTLTVGGEYSVFKPHTMHGAHVIFNVDSGVSSVNTLSMKMYGVTSFEDEYLLFDSISMTETGVYVFKIAPFVVQNIVGGKAIGLSDYLPDQFKIKVYHATVSPITYSISINFV